VSAPGGVAAGPVTIAEAAAALRAGSVTAVELTERALARADAVEPDLGCLLARFDDTARAAAAHADAELAAGTDRGPLHGIPLGVKDLLATVEGPTTAHSRVAPRGIAPGTDAPAVARLRARGAVIVGKASLSEYAFGSPDPDAGLPLPRNPWDRERWPGGSSSGTGSGVAAGVFLGGLGSDTGGSIRIPAACCGVTGLKPTAGRVPTDGCVPLAWSLDTVGPMARTAEDCGLLLAAIADAVPPAAGVPATGPAAVDALAARAGDLTGLRIGVERRHHGVDAGADPDVVAAVEAAVAVLEQAGAVVEEVVIDRWELADHAQHVILHAEAYTAHRASLREHWADYGSITRFLLAQGMFVSGPEYVQAQRVRSLVRADVARLLERVDVVVTPTIGVPAPRLDADFLALVPLFFTAVWNLTGHPALSVPVEPVRGLPVGMQVVGRPFADATVLAVGDAYQRRTGSHRLVPE
jgi:aspartyl-tRNA(Asn)/glutamyl-tRNA(Gln) amidotransferase subunit A